MIAKKFRLHKKKDFNQILKSPYKFYSNNFVLKFVENKEELSHFAVIVSTKISKKAVERNKLRRRIYEIIRLNISKIKCGYNLMIFVKKGVLNQEYQEIEQELFYIFKKAKLIHNL